MNSRKPLLQPWSCLVTATAVLAALFAISGERASAQDVPPAPPAPPIPVPPTPPPAPEPVQNIYTITPLVSNGAAASTTLDANLVNPWGIALAPDGPWWVVNNATQTVTVYNGAGVKQPPIVNLPSGANGPSNATGLVFSGTQEFVVSNGVVSAPARFIFAGEGGVLLGWSSDVDFANAIVAYDDGAGGAVYTGLALVTDGITSSLYAADFHNNKVDVFDGAFQKVTVPGGFADPALPEGYAPFGIHTLPLGGQFVIAVAYAQRADDTNDPLRAPGAGIVSLFDTQGVLLRTLVPKGGALNAPWGIALAPRNFGALSDLLLIGNFGDGIVNAFDPDTGEFVDSIRDAANQPIATENLRAIAFGNATRQQPSNTLFFTAGVGGETAGVFGRIDPPRSFPLPLP